MSALHPVECTVHEHNIIFGVLENVAYGLRIEGHDAEVAEYDAIRHQVWEHTSPSVSDRTPLTTTVVVSLKPFHWFLLASLLDVSAFQFTEDRDLELRLRDRISETLGDALPAPEQPSAPQRRQTTVPIGDLGYYRLYSALDTGDEPPMLGKDMGDQAWVNEGNRLIVRSDILTGTRGGTINVTAELLDGPPPLETGSWDDIAETSWPFWTTGGMAPPSPATPTPSKLIAAAPDRDAVALLDFDWVLPSTCMYRVRISATGRDTPTAEQHLIQMWRAPSAPEKLVKTAGLTGRRHRPEQPTTAQQAPVDSDIRAWAESEGIPVNQHGRIPSRLVAMYQAAHRAENPE